MNIIATDFKATWNKTRYALTADVRTMRGGIFWYWPDGSWYRLVAGSGTGRNI